MLQNDLRNAPKVLLFEYDDRFQALGDVIHYDYQKPRQLPRRYALVMSSITKSVHSYIKRHVRPHSLRSTISQRRVSRKMSVSFRTYESRILIIKTYSRHHNSLALESRRSSHQNHHLHRIKIRARYTTVFCWGAGHKLRHQAQS